ncbi:acyltransferase [Paraburkholderia sprentiae WSM5005]|uniref:Acyltransferase n=1 Tax=Paraburkholderia sprentiae WSM5005 TaxID=754502 RepID=A0A1I9YHB0_9BURK|nr:acyltransferase [Paraburkholderia sprentiae]APA85693.1 acyltransferase [Paraburkholderia sprentiae WSM5005]
MQKINNLTGLRAFAALLVVVHHFADNEGVLPLGMSGLVDNWVWGVDIFFVLSGFILAYTYLPSRDTAFGWGAYRSFMVKRFARVYPLHLATFLVFVGMWLVAKRTGHEFAHSSVDYTARTAVENLLLVQAWGLDKKISWNFVSWSISAEWFAYLFVFPLCAKVLSRLSRVTCGSIALVSWLLLCGYCFLFNGGDLGLTTFGVLRIVPQFIAGYWLFRVLKTREVGEVTMCISLGALVILMCMPTTWPVLLLPLILLVIAGLAKGGVVGDALFGNRVAVFLGEISFSIYLIHPILQIACNQVVRRLHVQQTTTTALTILIVELVVVVAGGALGYYLIEVPARRMIVANLQGWRRRSVEADGTVAPATTAS